MIIGLVGDLEGDRDWAVSRLRALGERGDVEVACQLGDLRFGMGEHHQEYLAAIESVCAEHDLRLLCIGGTTRTGLFSTGCRRSHAGRTTTAP